MTELSDMWGTYRFDFLLSILLSICHSVSFLVQPSGKHGVPIIANPRTSCHIPTVIRSLALLLVTTSFFAGAGSSLAQDSKESPPPPEGSGSEGRHKGPPPPNGKDGRRFGGFGMSPFGRGPGPGHDNDFDKLSEPEKKKVRAALEAAWKTAEVDAARERVMKANDDFRNAMRVAVEKADPEAAKILEKIRPPSPWDLMKDRVRLPRPDEPHFVEAAIGRLAMELYNFSKPEHRDAARKLHERVMQQPDILAAVEKMKSASGDERMVAFKALAELYKNKVDDEVKAIRGKMASPPPAKP